MGASRAGREGHEIEVQEGMEVEETGGAGMTTAGRWNCQDISSLLLCGTFCTVTEIEGDLDYEIGVQVGMEVEEAGGTGMTTARRWNCQDISILLLCARTVTEIGGDLDHEIGVQAGMEVEEAGTRTCKLGRV